MRTAPFGYKMIDDFFVVAELESQIVSWFFEQISDIEIICRQCW